MAVSLGPDWEFQVAIVTALNGNADIKSLLGTPPRIYQDVTSDPKLPYVTIGGGQNVPDLADCIFGATCYADLQIWSEAAGFEECKSIAATIMAVIAAATLTMTQNRCVDCVPDSLRFFLDPDGVSRQGVLTLKALIDPV